MSTSASMECLKENFVKGRLLDGRFRTVAPLNHGSFGMVFLATDITTGNDVAIKCLTKSASTDSSHDDRFEELECHQRFGFHSNLVNLVHNFETEHHTYLVLEYCANGDLYEAIRLNRGPLETEHVRDFMLQLISAVEFMHANGIYHRDIKPENIFLTHDGDMKLGDFGLATREPWCHEACVGSDRYMAPEQYDPGSTGYSPAQADIWSVGVCLLNILFARNPFVTPTESDVLFADYVRDRQSLFDIFPNMSQDTFEILTHCMSIDPTKRSLAEVRQCILRAISFTIDDESLDEFCTEDREVVTATVNREPLRTPSIQSPQVNQGDSFPWAKALQASPPQAIRQLSAIPDNESYTEDLFPPSEVAGTSWFSVHADSSSLASVLDSAMGESFRSLHLGRKPQTPQLPRSDPVPITGSLPSHTSKPLPSLSMVFGKHANDQISKSWSDLWEEEESENEESALQMRREQNSRSWSQESQNTRLPDPLAGLREPDSASPTKQIHISDIPPAAPRAIRAKSLDVDSDTGTSSSTPRPFPQQLSTPKKVSPNVDKWAELGDKRRNFKTRELFGPQRAANNWRRDWGLGSSGFDHGPRTKRESPQSERRRRLFLEKDWRRETGDAHKHSPHHSPLKFAAYDGSIDEDLDLVGGWHDLHL
jgi:serine/threonine protein kinase